MTSTTASAPAARVREKLAVWGHVVLDGKHPWGTLQIAPVDRTASAMSYRLAVYPPGITAAERRALVFRAHWPATGGSVGILLAGLLGPVIGGVMALAFGAAFVAAGFIVSALAAGSARQRVVRLRATRIVTFGHREILGDLKTLEREAGLLLRLDERAAAGAVGAVEYEHLWGQVYHEVAALQSEETRGKSATR